MLYPVNQFESVSSDCPIVNIHKPWSGAFIGVKFDENGIPPVSRIALQERYQGAALNVIADYCSTEIENGRCYVDGKRKPFNTASRSRDRVAIVPGATVPMPSDHVVSIWRDCCECRLSDRS